MVIGISFVPSSRRKLLVAVLSAAAVAVTAPLWSQQATKLYLKDGSYQLVKSYEVHGDRVRFYSIERSDWEEIPFALVDLAATRRGKTEDAQEALKAIEKAQELEKEHFERPADTGQEVAPGVKLPPAEGIYSFDGFRLIRLIQSNGEIVTDKKRLALNLAMPGPIFKNRQFVVLPGTKAAVRISNPQAVFYAQFADGLGGKLKLITVKPGKENRVVESIETRVRPSHASESREALPVTSVQVAPGLFKVTLAQPLSPGEYAFAEVTQSNKLNLDVWDFGIDGSTKASKAPVSTGPPAPMSEAPPGQQSTSPKRNPTRRPGPLPGPTQSPPVP
jgi:hypothetical protein